MIWPSQFGFQNLKPPSGANLDGFAITMGSLIQGRLNGYSGSWFTIDCWSERPMVLMDGWRSRRRMGTMKRGRFVKITVAESSLCGRGPLWTWIFIFYFLCKRKKKTSAEGQQAGQRCHCLTLKEKPATSNLLVKGDPHLHLHLL